MLQLGAGGGGQNRTGMYDHGPYKYCTSKGEGDSRLRISHHVSLQEAWMGPPATAARVAATRRRERKSLGFILRGGEKRGSESTDWAVGCRWRGQSNAQVEIHNRHEFQAYGYGAPAARRPRASTRSRVEVDQQRIRRGGVRSL